MLGTICNGSRTQNTAQYPTMFLFYVPNLPSWRFTLASEGLATNNYPGLFKSQLDRLPNLKPEFLYLVVDDFGLNYRSIFAPQPH